jgi:hypothetical protein
MKMKKSIIAALTATIIMLAAFAPVFLIQPARGADPTDWYKTVPGVLDSDTYSLYPFDAKSLTIGMSKFGEMIDANTMKGLSYGPTDMDPFANEGFVPEFEWNQGWLINITYSYAGEFRNVWAFALFSDSYNTNSIGGDWKMAPSPDSTNVVGGRKYGGYRWAEGALTPIGYATTAPLTVLYDGPRRFIALSQTTIGEDASTPLVGVHITFVFDKVKKYVILYKDVKLLDNRKFSGVLAVEFSNRGEWDLGKSQAPPSFAHFFTGLDTTYESGYHPFYTMGEDNAPYAYYDVAQVISTNPEGYVGFAAFWPSLISRHMEATYLTDRTRMLTSLETYTADFEGDGDDTVFSLLPNNPAPVEYPRGAGVWSDAPMVFVDGKIRPNDAVDPLGYTWSSPVVVFNNPPGDGSKIWVIYKQPVNKVDMSDEPKTPYIIGEWDFDLSWANPDMSTNQFRGVTVYGVTDNHNALDIDGGPQINQLDREVVYQLNEVFNPWDLSDAVYKDETRWVDFTLDPVGTTYYVLENTPVLNIPDDQWDQYAMFSEKVEDLTLNSTVLNRYLGDYALTVVDGVGNITGLNPEHQYKILYSTSSFPDDQQFAGQYEWVTVGRDAHSVDSVGAALVTHEFTEAGIHLGNGGMDMEGTSYAYEIPYLLSRSGTGTGFSNYWITPDTTSPGQRLGLKDDWCTTWPVASSNIISVGGPLANQMTEYFNSFTDAYYSEPWFTPYTPFKGTLAALSCWSKNVYSNVGVLNGTGYATIGTYLDLNGTVGFVIYGLDARDTFYASKFFKEDILYVLRDAPSGVTSIVIKIDYSDYKHPSWDMVEALGTISEWHTLLHPDP